MTMDANNTASKISGLDESKLLRAIAYQEDTGEIVWKRRPEEDFADKRAASTWNAKYVGEKAFSSLTDRGYLAGHFQGIALKAHRVAWLCIHGKWPEFEVDHINGVKTDNRRCNLRDVDRSENAKNVTSLRSAKPFLGVSLFWGGPKYRARITVSGRPVHLGYFDTVDDALSARAAAEQRFGFFSGIVGGENGRS